jgi:hypothetical protein
VSMIDVTDRDRELLISSMLFDLQDRVGALHDLIGDCPGPSAWTTSTARDVLDTLDEVVRRGDALRALGFGR